MSESGPSACENDRPVTQPPRPVRSFARRLQGLSSPEKYKRISFVTRAPSCLRGFRAGGSTEVYGGAAGSGAAALPPSERRAKARLFLGWGALRGERPRSPRVNGFLARQPERSPEVIATKSTPEGRSRRLHMTAAHDRCT
jgi:hypothetical protein